MADNSSLESPISHASLSRDLQADSSRPHLLHSLHEVESSVLSLAASDTYIFSGSQSQDITVWDKKTYTHRHTLCGHTGSVLALVHAQEREWLFSSSGDSTVRIWSSNTLNALYIIDTYLETGAGDLFSMAWSLTLKTIYIGCQNTSLQWFNFDCPQFRLATDHPPDSGTATPTSSSTRKAHKFFDSYPQYERKPADIYAKNSRIASPNLDSILPRLQISNESVLDSAHYGYIYAMTFVEESQLLITGSGDETIKVWDCRNGIPSLVHTFECCYGAIYALVSKVETVYAGCQDGHVKVLDLETKTLVRTIIVQEGVDILSLSLMNSDLYTCTANGRVQRYSASFDCTASWRAHDGIVLSSIITLKDSRDGANFRLLTGGNDENIKVWDIVPPKERHEGKEFENTQPTGDTMAYALSQFISFASVSKCLSNREDCRQAAIWLKKCLSQLGAQSSLLSTGEGTNPLVLGTFQAQQRPSDGRRPRRVLFYGHYDVISAPTSDESWASDPFKLTGKNGYLYGRGVSDDKGPIMAVACATAELLYRRALGLDVVFLIEGEEECGSQGFADAVRKHKDLMGPVDAILVSNSTWIAEEPPCITYGLRGVVHCAVQISNNLPDLHSGIDGGGVAEPMLDMVNLLATLTDKNQRVLIPGFYSCVRPQTLAEKELYQKLSAITEKPASALSSRWREPSLTVHSIEISGPRNATVIPSSVKAQVSLRIVPDQDLATIVDSLCSHLRKSFEALESTNELKLSIDHTADWWLGDLEGDWFEALEDAVREEWGVEPLRIREGGSIPSIPYLEKEFGCHALHLPMGQSSDQAHLPNERISLTNLHGGKSVAERFLVRMGS